MDPTQSISRIKSFLNSRNLTATDASRELYYTFLSLNRSACERLAECKEFLLKNDKVSAFSVVQQTPELFSLLEELMFPQRDMLNKLAFLYGWDVPDFIDAASVRELKEAMSGVNMLLQLVAEYRNIAGQGNLKKEIQLLTSIASLDKEDSKWSIMLRAVKEQYARLLISDARKAMIAQDYILLLNLHDELSQLAEDVSVHELELFEITKAVKSFLNSESEKHSTFLLNKLKTACDNHDIRAIETTLMSWNTFCKQNKSSMTAAEKQLCDNASYLLSKIKSKETELTNFQRTVFELNKLIDNNASLSTIKKQWRTLQQSSFNISGKLQEKVENHISCREKKLVFSVVAILLCAALVISLGGWGAFTVLDTFNKQEQLEHVKENLQAADYDEMKRVYSEITAEHPELLEHPDVLKAKDVLKKIEDAEDERVEKFKQLLREILNSKSQWAFDENILRKIEQLENLAKNEQEKNTVSGLKQSFVETVDWQRSEAKRELANKTTELYSFRDRIMFLIKNRDFKNAETELANFKQLISQLKNMPNVQMSVLENHREVLNSAHILEQLLIKTKLYDVQVSATMAEILSAAEVDHLSQAVEKLSTLSSSSADNMYNLCQILSKDIKAFRKLQTIQRISNINEIPDTARSSGLYLDRVKFKSITAAEKAAKARLISVFNSMHRINSQYPLCFVRFKEDATDNYIDIYVQPNSVVELYNEIQMRTDGDENVKVRRVGSHFHFYELTVGNKKNIRCTLAYPTKMKKSRIKLSQARHQTLVEFIAEDLKTVEHDNLKLKIVDYIEMVMNDTLCSVSWKVKIVYSLLKAISSLDLNSSGFIAKALQDMESPALRNDVSKMRDFIDNFDVRRLHNEMESSRKQYNLHKIAAMSKFKFFGIAFDGHVKITPPMRQTRGYILCFDESRSKCVLFGCFDGRKITCYNEFSQNKGTRLLFIATNIDYAAIHKDFSKDADKVKIPDFWPINYREVAK